MRAEAELIGEFDASASRFERVEPAEIAMALDSLHHIVDRLSLAPGVRKLRKRRFDAYFTNNKGLNLFRGVYGSYEEALAAIPPAQRRGYDSDEAAELYTEWLDIFDYDYPAMFWLQRAMLDGARTIFDVGGNIGIKYYAYRRHCAFPDNLRWTVADVPAVVRKGRALAQAQAADKLAFSESTNEMSGCDVLFASGSLQYLPRTLPELLQEASYRPPWIILNITPLHPVHTFYTVNSFGPGYCAYRVQQRDAFLESVRAAGYHVRAEWKNPGKVLELPFEHGYGLHHYSGLCLQLSSS